MSEEKEDLPPEDASADPTPADTAPPPTSSPESQESFLSDEPRTRDLFSRRRSQYRPFYIVLAVVAGFFILLMVYDAIRSRSHERALERIVSGAADSSQPPQAGEIQGRTAEREQPPPSYALPDDVFTGTAPLMVKPEGAVLSEQNDPELAALADTLNQRVRILYGVDTRRNGDTVTESAGGNYLGFRVSSVHSHTPEQVVRDEITVSTPSRGTFVVKDRMLDAVRGTDHGQIIRDLENAGIDLVSEIQSGKGLVEVRLRWREVRTPAGGSDFVIGDSYLGPLRLGIGAETLAAVLPGDLNILKRQVLVENDYIFVYKVEDTRNRVPLFYIYEHAGKVDGIEVVNDRFKTARGIGIGSSVAEMRMAYTGVRASSLTRGMTYLIAGDGDAKFILAEDPRIDVTRPLVPFDVKIVSIIIGRSPYMR